MVVLFLSLLGLPLFLSDFVGPSPAFLHSMPHQPSTASPTLSSALQYPTHGQPRLNVAVKLPLSIHLFLVLIPLCTSAYFKPCLAQRTSRRSTTPRIRPTGGFHTGTGTGIPTTRFSRQCFRCWLSPQNPEHLSHFKQPAQNGGSLASSQQRQTQYSLAPWEILQLGV